MILTPEILDLSNQFLREKAAKLAENKQIRDRENQMAGTH
jgi:hypothetical protein